MNRKTPIGKKLGSILLAVVLVFGLLPGGGLPVRAANVEITDVSQFNDGLKAVIEDGGGTLTLDLGPGRHELPYQSHIAAIQPNTEVLIRNKAGSPVTLYAPHSRHFNLNFNNTVTLKLTFDGVILDGMDTLGGIDIDSTDGTFILENAVMQNCAATFGLGAYGGAIFRGASGETILRNCRFINNRAATPFDSSGGALRLSGGTTTIEDCVFTNNRSFNGPGGALAIVHNTGGLTITNTIFTDNSANGNGGAILITNNSAAVTVTNSSFTSNTADGDGGAIHLPVASISSLSFTGSNSFADNMAGRGYEIDPLDLSNPLYSGWTTIPSSDPFSHIANNYDVVYTGSSSPSHALLFYRNDGINHTPVYRIHDWETLLDFTGLFPVNPTWGSSVFLGWNTDPDGSGLTVTDATNPSFLSPGQNVKLYAQWDRRVAVTFDSNGGSAVAGQIVPLNGTVTKPEDPTRRGYTFDRWYSDASLTTPYNFSDPVADDLTLYAGWIEGSDVPTIYTVSFKTRGGSDVAAQAVNRHGTIDRPLSPTRSGYLFTGWHIDPLNSQPYDFDTPVTGDFLLYAGWKQTAGEPVIPYMAGYKDGTFRPDAVSTRAEAAQMLYTLAKKDIRPPENGADGPELVFTDVERGSWYYEAVSYLSKAGIISGYPNGTFEPEGTVTRAEFISMIIHYAGQRADSRVGFPDTGNHWAAAYIAAAKDAGLVSGYPNGSFYPENSLTRAQAVTILNGMLGRDTDSSLFQDTVMPFPDVAKTHWSYFQIMTAAVPHKAGW